MAMQLAKLAPLVGALFIPLGSVHAASCCGGGSASSLIMAKSSQRMVAASLDIEHYDGLWRDDGHWVPDPTGSDLNQYRLNLGYAQRLADRWQASLNLPYAVNANHYGGVSSDTQGFGDASLNVLYETFDDITCVYQVNTIEDLKPAVYLGLGLTLPTGISPYDDVSDNFDITGRGFYRVDGSLQVEKTVFPWNAAFGYTYGRYLERPVNREYGRYVEPYHKRLGDRRTTMLSFGRSFHGANFSTWTATLAYSDMSEDHARIDGHLDPTTGLQKRSYAFTLAWANVSKSWVLKGTWSHAPRSDDWGRNFPTTDVLTLGVTHVL